MFYNLKMNLIPKRIICLTEESVEFLYDLGLEHLIVGVSVYVERPIEAKNKKRVTAFTHANIKKIKELNPDLILGFSDIQKDIAKDLIAEGMNVFISNQRSLDEIIQYMFWLGCLVGEKEKAENYLKQFIQKISDLKKINYKNRPRVYIEEWDEPMINGIHWFVELVELCGGEVILKERSIGTKLAKERFVDQSEVINANPDIIFACWCGKKFDYEKLVMRDGFREISAVKNKQVFELDPAIFLQPGPALFKEGVDILQKIISNQ